MASLLCERKIYLKEGYFISENDIHPNEKAWDEVVPKLVVKMKL